MKAITSMAKLRKQSGREVTVILKGRLKLDSSGDVGLYSSDDSHYFMSFVEADFENGALVLKGDK
jgi:hypothetical protein